MVVADPLYKWAMTPIKAKRRQQDLDPGEILEGSQGPAGTVGAAGTAAGAAGGGSSQQTAAAATAGNGMAAGATGAEGAAAGSSIGNADAERAVLRVKQKLEGVEAGEGGPRGVSGQVAALLSDAQDPGKLCRMFQGWAAWM